MDILEQFLHKISYKFPKGYPDMGSKNDVSILFEEIKKLGINLEEVKKEFDFLSPQAQEVGNELSNTLNIPKNNIKADSKTRIIMLTDENRNAIFSKLIDLNFTRNLNIPGSSQGGVERDGIQVIIKPLSKQGAQSAGKQNEADFNGLINSHIQKNDGDPITVVLKGSGKTLTYKNVAEAVDASTSGATEFDKSDTDLIDPSKNIIVGISLKKRNAVRWESSKRRPIEGVDVFKSFIEKDGIQVIVKPKSKQGAQSAGKQNEADFNGLINSHIQKNDGEPITVVLKGSGKTLTYKNVAEAVDASTSGATEFDKSDTDLIDPSGKGKTTPPPSSIIVGISLKKRNAVRWESSKRRPIEGVDVFKSFVEKVGKIGSDDEVGEFENVVLTPLEQKGKYKLTNPETNQTLSKVVIKNTPPSVIKNVVFGDTDKKTIVVKETFEGGFSDFSYDEDKAILTINCYKIYTEVDDLIGTEDEPVFAFSNHIGQAFGIEFRSFSKGLLYKGDEPKGSSAEIDFNDLK